MNMMDEIIEGNRIIAEFMLVKIPDRHYLEMNPQLQYYGNSIDEFGTVNNLVSERQLKYHSSWDWLMPVVEKIEMLHWNDRQNNFTPDINFFLQNEIEFVWRAVVKFIKWYNKQTV